MKNYILAFDAGTTSQRCLLFDKMGKIVSVAQREITQYYPHPGWVEHDASEIWATQIGVAIEAMQRINVSAEEIAAIGITNQRETTIVWDKNTGEPVMHAIVWQCRRTAEYCDGLKAQGVTEMIRKKTGLELDAYFSASKIHWILENVPGAREKAERGDLLFGTVDCWLIWKLTQGNCHVTDVSNASRTMLFNIHTMTWDDDLLKLFDIPKAMLPTVCPSSSVYGETELAFFGVPIPIAGVAGDQQAALFGQTCFSAGDVKNTYGTGCFMLMNTGDTPVLSQHGLVTTVAWKIGDKISYALEGSIFVAGAAVQWLRDELRVLDTAPQSEELATAVADTNGCYVVPAFTGLGAPFWDPYARGTIVGLTRGVNRNHLVRATLESMAYQSLDVLNAMQEDAGLDFTALRVDGGAARNNFLMQFQSDMMQRPVYRPASIETTARGAAFLAGLAVGFWPDYEALYALQADDACFTPLMSVEKRDTLQRGWHRAVRCAMGWAKEE